MKVRAVLFVILERCVLTLAFLMLMTVSVRGQIDTLVQVTSRTPLVDVNRNHDRITTKISRTQTPSLFIGQNGTSLVAPYPARPIRAKAIVPQAIGRNASPQARLLALIASAEAGQAGYDAVQHGARIRPAKRPTDMTIGEIYDWITATPGQPHAIGRYQFIPSTLRRLVWEADFDRRTPFSPAVQDQLAEILLHDAGLVAFQLGDMSRNTFMHNLAKIWAGLPTASGKSFYDGYAGNSATITRATYEAEMRRIYPG